MSVLDRIKNGELKVIVLKKCGSTPALHRPLYDLNEPLDEEAKDILRLAAIGERARWIQVSEMLPNHRQMVDIYTKFGRYINLVYQAEDKTFWDEENNRTWKIKHVTHWALIPEPPVGTEVRG
jgi:hypothetical protein